jgi:putative peptidoglycan lipid II flippase
MRANALVVFAGMCLSMALGVGFQSFFAARLGTSQVADAFYIGATLPTIIAVAVVGSAANALVKHAVTYPQLLDIRDPNSVSRRLLLWSALPALVVLVVGLALAYFGGGGLHHNVGIFLALTSPITVVAAVASCGSVIALARGRFVLGTWGPAMNGIGLLASAVVLAPGGLSIWKLALAVDCGYVVQLFFVLPLLMTSRRTGTSPPVDEVAVVAMGALVVLIGASLVYKSQPLVERVVGAAVGHGVPAALGYADKITQGFTQLAVFGFALASLPGLAQVLRDREHVEAERQVSFALATTAASTAAVLAFAASSAPDLVRVLYERGAFGVHAARTTEALVYFALPTVVFGALAGPLVTLNYAAGRVSFVVRVGLLGFVVGGLGTVLLSYAVGYRGIVLGTAAGAFVTFFIFARTVGAVLDGWSWRTYARMYGVRLLAVFAALATCAFACRQLLTVPQSSSAEQLAVLALRLAVLVGVGFVGGLLFRQGDDVRRISFSRAS